MRLFISWICLAQICAFASGKRCFQCQDLPHPSDCRHIADCPDTDECFVDEFITGSGTVLYNTGCRPNQRCHGAGRRDIVARADIFTCDECCFGELCNLQGCGQTAPSRNTRGPYCFACDAQSGENNCRNVKMCSTDQVCMIAYSETDQFFATSCITQQQCTALQTHLHQALPVGKRNTVTFNRCSTCCTDDFCNNNCTHADGQWSDWSPWTTCSATCDHGVKTRHRACDNPQPQNNGKWCTGNNQMSTVCSATQSCHVTIDGAWSFWGGWSTCSHSCGAGGTQHRERKCNNPPPQYYGADCYGPSSDTQTCGSSKCPVNGGWSDWSSWSTQGYSKTRHRSCTKPAPKHNGATCYGASSQTLSLSDKCKQASGFKFVQDSGVQLCLRYSTVTHSWPESRDLCKLSGGHLVIIPNSNVDHAVLSFIRHKNLNEHTHGEGKYAWIGMYAKHNTWHWADSREPFNYNRFNAASENHNQPNMCVCENWQHMEHWWAVHCDSTKHHYICEIDISD